MTKFEKYTYWVMLSDYDLQTLPCLIESKRWVYVAYICQQAVERQPKGMYVFYNDMEAPKTHNVNFLFSKVVSSERFQTADGYESFLPRREAIEDFLVDIMFYYLSDYPFSYKNIMNRFIKKDVALSLYEKTKETVAYLRSLQPEVELPHIV